MYAIVSFSNISVIPNTFVRPCAVLSEMCIYVTIAILLA